MLTHEKTCDPYIERLKICSIKHFMFLIVLIKGEIKLLFGGISKICIKTVAHCIFNYR